MAPYLVLFGRAFPTYSLLARAGAAAAWGYFHWRLRRRGENPGRTEQAFLWGVLGALVGAKLLYLLPQLPQLAADLPLLGQDPARFSARYLTGGFCVLRGAAGGLGGGGALLPAAEAALRPVGGRPGARRPPSSTPLAGWGAFWPGAATASPPRRGGGGVTFFPGPAGPPTGWPWCRCSCTRPPGASSSSCCWTGWPGGGGPGGSCCRSTCPSTGPSAFLLEFLRGTGPGGSGAPVHLPVGGVGHPGGGPAGAPLAAIQTKPPAAALMGGAAGGFAQISRSRISRFGAAIKTALRCFPHRKSRRRNPREWVSCGDFWHPRLDSNQWPAA